MMKLLTSYEQLGDKLEPFEGVNDSVVMTAISEAEMIEEGKLPKRVSDNLANRGISLRREQCMADPDASSIADGDERSRAISFHYALVKI